MKVKELLADPMSWTQGGLARDIWGCGLPPRDEQAICWCIAGGIEKCYPNFEEKKEARKKILRVIDPEIDPENRILLLNTIFDFNDKSTHEEVRKVLEQADV